MRLLRKVPESTLDFSMITFLFIIGCVVVNPIGNFPLNDDWCYALATKHLLETGEFRPLSWTSMPLFTNAIWGALFCLPAGFSFTALRVSSLVAALIASFGTYCLLRQTGASRQFTLVATLALALNPLFFAFSFTFMTDVLFTALEVWAAFFYVRWFQFNRVWLLVAATGLTLMGTVSRQVILCLPLAFAICALAARKEKRAPALVAIGPLAVCSAAFLLYNHWLSATGRMPASYGGGVYESINGFLHHPETIPLALVSHAYVAIMYLGLFLLPVLMWDKISNGTGVSLNRRYVILAALFCGAVANWIYMHAAPYGINSIIMPLGYNVLTSYGIGPLLLHDICFLGQGQVESLPTSFWTVVTLASLCGAVILVEAVCDFVERIYSDIRIPHGSESRSRIGMFLLVSVVIYVAPLLLSGFFDEYLFPLLPLISAAISAFALPSKTSVQGALRPLQIASVITLIITGAYALAGTRDFLSWNRTRWIALNHLTDVDHISASKIDGGYEFNGLYLYDPKFPINAAIAASQAPPRKSWWWVADDEYELASGKLPGHEVLDEYSYFNWLPPGKRQILVLKRTDADTPHR